MKNTVSMEKKQSVAAAEQENIKACLTVSVAEGQKILYFSS